MFESLSAYYSEKSERKKTHDLFEFAKNMANNIQEGKQLVGKYI